MTDISEITSRTEILSLGAKGDGLSNTLAVPFALPGDVIEDGQLVTPSPHRVAPVCPHFGTCGGCVLQHASDPFLADWKVGIVSQALRSQALPEEIRAVHVSPRFSRRRAVFSGRRTKKTVQLGFYGRRSELLIPIAECPLLVPDITGAMEPLKAVTRMAATRSSVVKLSVSLSEAGLDLAVSNGRPLEADGVAALAEITSGFARVSWNGEVVLFKTPPLQRFGPAAVVPRPGPSFKPRKKVKQHL